MILSLWNRAQVVDIHTWFWLGAALLVLGMIFFTVMGLADGKGHENYFMTYFFITLMASTTYIAMALGLGRTTNADGVVFYYARYLDWMVTTPLLLLNLAMLATFNIGRRAPLVAGLLGLDVFMILTGLVAGLASGSAKWVFYFLSCLAFLAIVGIIWGVLRVEAARLTAEESSVYNRATAIVTGVWTLYPVVWLIGTEGIGAIGLSGETMLYMILDVSAKIGLGCVLLNAVRKVVPRKIEDDLKDVLVPISN